RSAGSARWSSQSRGAACSGLSALSSAYASSRGERGPASGAWTQAERSSVARRQGRSMRRAPYATPWRPGILRPMVQLLALSFLPGRGRGGRAADEEERVGSLRTTGLGSLPRASLELEAPITSSGSAFVTLGSPLSIGGPLLGRLAGPHVAAGWRVFLFGRGP